MPSRLPSRSTTGPPERARHQWRGVLDRPGHATAAGTSERPARAADEAEGDARAVAVRVAERDDRRADAGRIGPELERGRALGRGLEDGDVAIGVDAGDGRIGRSAIREGDGHLVAVEVVGVGQDPVLGDHHAGAAAPSVADADHRRSDALRDLADLPAQVCQGCHVRSCASW